MKGAFFDSRYLITVMELLSLPHRLNPLLPPTNAVEVALRTVRHAGLHGNAFKVRHHIVSVIKTNDGFL